MSTISRRSPEVLQVVWEKRLPIGIHGGGLLALCALPWVTGNRLVPSRFWHISSWLTLVGHIGVRIEWKFWEMCRDAKVKNKNELAKFLFSKLGYDLDTEKLPEVIDTTVLSIVKKICQEESGQLDKFLTVSPENRKKAQTLIGRAQNSQGEANFGDRWQEMLLRQADAILYNNVAWLKSYLRGIGQSNLFGSVLEILKAIDVGENQ